MEMQNKKLNLIVEAIAKARQVTPEGREVKACLHDVEWASTDVYFVGVGPEELNLVLEKLQDDEKVLRVREFLDRSSALPPVHFGNFTVEVLDNFDTWYAKHQTQQASSPRTLPPALEPEPPPEPEVAYRITYTGAREVLVNGRFQLAKPIFDSENDVVFHFLCQHPNEKFTVEQIQEKVNVKLVKPLHKIVENLGFIGDLKRVFFDVSKNSIRFRNPVTSEDLKKLGVTRIKLH